MTLCASNPDIFHATHKITIKRDGKKKTKKALKTHRKKALKAPPNCSGAAT